MSNERDYEVGYGQPPKESRFKKGQSGNPSGRARRKGKRLDELPELISRAMATDPQSLVRKLGSNPPAVEAIIIRLILSALKGEVRTARMLFEIWGDNSAKSVLPSADIEELSDNDNEVLQHFLDRATEKRRLSASTEGEDP